jgi:hypothetical protein
MTAIIMTVTSWAPVVHACNPSYLEVPGHPGQESLKRSHVNRKKLDKVVHFFYPSYSRKYKIGGLQSRLAWVESETLSLK